MSVYAKVTLLYMYFVYKGGPLYVHMHLTVDMQLGFISEWLL